MASVPVLARLIARPLNALDEHLPAALEGQPHSVHQARVATRRLRELLPIVGRVLHDGPRRRLRRRLRALTRALGPVREADVTLASIATMTAETAAPVPTAERVSSALAAERAARLAELTDRFDRGRVDRLLGRLRRLEATLASGAEPRTWRRRLAGRVRRRADALSRAVADAGALFVSERLHQVRIAAKQLRYALEVAGEARLAGTAASVRALKDVQDVLGKLHDADVLHAAIKRVLGAEALAEYAEAGAVADRPGRTADAMADAADANAADPNAADANAADANAADAAWFDREITAETRRLHARYLRRQARLVALADHALDTVAPRIEQGRAARAAAPAPARNPGSAADA